LTRRREQPRASAQDSPVEPVLLPEQDLARSGVAVEPARQKRKVFGERAARFIPGAHERRRFEAIPENLLGRARRGGDLRKAHDEWLIEIAGAYRKRQDALGFGGALQDERIQVLDAARQFRPPAQGIVQLFNLLVNCGGFLEVQLVAGPLALRFV